MIGDTSLMVTVQPLDEFGNPDNTTSHRVKFVNLPAGVTVTPNDLVNGTPITGLSTFSLYAGGAAAPGTFVLRVEKSNDSSVNGQQSVTIYRTVSQFTLDPPVAPFTGKAGVPFLVTVTARDSFGAVVQAFHDDVDVSAAVGGAVVNGGTYISGATFVKGVSVATVTLLGTTIGSLDNTITATARKLYPGQATLSHGQVSVTIEPNVFNHILLTFPGETLTPGTGSGKTGQASAATAGVPIVGVSAWLEDQYNNPIRPDRNPEPTLYPVTVTYVSVTHPATDTVPASRQITTGNQDAMNGLFTLVVSGVNHTIQASESKKGTSDSSSIPVNSAAAANYTISTITSPRSAVSPFTVTVQAVDALGNLVTSYNSAATVSCSLGLGTVDVNQAVAGPQTQIQFVNGRWTGSVLVTKAVANPIASLHVDDGNGRAADSNTFRVDAGPAAQIFVTLPGETFLDGAWPGNTGTPNTFTAGDLISADIRVVDASWNVVSVPSGRVLTLASPTGFIDATTGLTMDPSGGPLTVTNIRLRTAYPQQQRISASIGSLSLTGQSDLFTVYPRPYSKVVLVLPGEALSPGNPAESDGKTGAVSPEFVNGPFNFTAYLTDDYFNPLVNPPAGGWPKIQFSLPTPVGGTAVFPSPNPFQFTGAILPQSMTLKTLGSNVVQAHDVSNGETTTVTVDVQAGQLDHFTLTGAQNVNDGNSFNLTVTAYDQYGNIARNFGGIVNLELLSAGAVVGYPGVISPTTVTFVANPVSGGVMTVPVTVNYAGQQMGSGPDNLQVEAYFNLPPQKQGLSDPFSVFEDDAQFSGIVVLLPGETFQPGGFPPFKSGTPDAKVAGDAVGVSIYAVDNHGNRIDYSGSATLSSPDGYSDFRGNPVTIANGYATKFIYLFTAGPQRLVAASGGFNSVSTVTINSGSTTAGNGKLLLLAPGENYRPGSATGKDGSPNSIVANTLTTFTILECDNYYNTDTAFSGGDIQLTSSDGALNLSGLVVNSGSATVSNLYLRGITGSPLVRVTAADDSASNKSSYSDVPVTPGAHFDITVPSTITVGQTFPMQIKLIDPATGLPGAFNQNVFLTALRPDGTAALLPIGISTASLLNGTVTVTQHYDYVEPIQIRVTDTFNRIAFSQNISVQPNGLKYVLTAPAQTTTDDIFSVSLKLYDTIYDQNVIRSLDHNVAIHFEAGGNLAAGTYPIKQVSLSQGEAIFNESYTKAESVVIIGTGTIAGFSVQGSANFVVGPGVYSKVQILAPGEIAAPGVPSDTGKNSTGLVTQAAKQPFTVNVLAVDRYWNLVQSVSDPNVKVVKLTADDGSLVGLSTAAFINGICQISGVSLNLPPSVKVTAQDVSRPDIFTQSVVIPVSGQVYEATLDMNYDQFYTGPPRDFRVAVALYRFDGVNRLGLVTGESGNFYVVPMTPDLQPLDPANLYNPNPVDSARPNMFRMDPSGIVNFTLSYRTAEDVIFKIYDDAGWQGYNVNRAIIHFVPVDVVYQVTVPNQTLVGPPNTFPMQITAQDINTHTVAKNTNNHVSIQAISVETGSPGGGVLQLGATDVTAGQVQFQQAYTQAGLTMFKVFDDKHFTYSPIVNMLPGPLTRLDSDAPKTLEAGTTRQINVTFYDAYNNPISNTASTLSLSLSAAGSLNYSTIMSNASGTSAILFTAATNYSGPAQLLVKSGAFTLTQSIRIMGPPTTTINFGGLAADMVKGVGIKPGDPITLSASYDPGLTLDGMVYAVDSGSTRTYTGPFTIPGPGAHLIHYYGVTQGVYEHTEAVNTTPTVYVSAVTTAAEGLVNYPNPFHAGRESTSLEFAASAGSDLSLEIFNMMGQKVYGKDFVIGESGTIPNADGVIRVFWDGRNNDGVTVANGGYVAILKIKADGRTFKRKIAVVK